MKIYRDGKEIELTAEELRMAYEEKKLEHTNEDVVTKANEMHIDLVDADVIAITERFERALGKHDTFWDCYWCTMENVIEEYVEEGK